MARVITKNDLPELLLNLGKKYQVIAPVKKEGHPSFDAVAFRPYQKNDVLDLNYGTTILPPKEYVLPPKETLFHFIAGEVKKPDVTSTLIFGVNLEDLKGLERLDVAMARPIKDEPYENRKQKRVAVALDHFTPPAGEAYDLYLMWLNSELLAGFAKTKAGREILNSKLFKEHPIRIPKVKQISDPLLDHPKLAKAVEKSRHHQIWEKVAEQCFGCGICSYACPLCYCFEVDDEMPNPESNNGSRFRTWDSCMLGHFAETTVENFRPELKDRIYNWYHHKFVRMPKEYGFSGCIGCNRCTIYCPARINYRLVLKEVLNDYLKQEKLHEKPLVHSKKS